MISYSRRKRRYWAFPASEKIWHSRLDARHSDRCRLNSCQHDQDTSQARRKQCRGLFDENALERSESTSFSISPEHGFATCKMNVIFTGSTGFIGRKVLEQCLQNSSITFIITLTRRDLPPSWCLHVRQPKTSRPEYLRGDGGGGARPGKSTMFHARLSTDFKLSSFADPPRPLSSYGKEHADPITHRVM